MNSQQKISTEIDRLLEIFQTNPNKKFEYKKLKEQIALPDKILKNFLNILKTEGYIEVEYKIREEYYFLKKEKKKTEEHQKVIFKEIPQISTKQNKEREIYEKIEKMLEVLLDKKTKYLELKEKRKEYLKKVGAKNLGKIKIEQDIKKIKGEIKLLIKEIKSYIKNIK
ncbi:MAG: hypothetical protein QXH71_02415 [Candidatus Anstonellaceae archaeon]